MAHLANYLPEEVELGAVETTDWSTEIITTDGGYEVRNNRWASPLRRFEVSFPAATRDDPVYTAVRDLFEQAEGSLHSFNFRTWTDESGGTVLAVRFDGPLEISGIASHLDKIGTVALVEVRT